MRLPASLDAWGEPHFAATLKRELAKHAHELPLQQALAHSSAVADEPVTVVLLDAQADDALVRVKVGIFFSGIVAGCSCSDDTTPVEPQTEYCELSLSIGRETGEVSLMAIT
jgi:hypothetical protein